MLNKTIEKTKILVPQILSYDIMDDFQREIKQIISTRPGLLEIDCSEIEHVTSSHVNLIWQAHSACLKAGVEACLVHPPDVLINVLHVLDLSEEISTCNGAERLPSKHTGCGTIENDQFSLSIPLTSDGTTEALKKFREFIEQVGLPKTCAIELETVFYETITNVRLHSGLSSERELKFSAVTTSNAIEMTFVDQGKEFDPTATNIAFDPASAIKERRRHGLGLIMISRMSTKLSYHRSEDGQNVFVIERSGAK